MRKLIKLIFLIIMLLEIKLFYIIPLPQIINNYNSYNNKILILGIIIFSVGILILKDFNGCFKGRIFNKYIAFISVLCLIQVMITSIMYTQGLKTSLMTGYFYLVILLYYLLSYFLCDENKYKFVIKLLTIFSIIASVVFIFQSLLYDSGHFFLKISQIVNNTVEMRAGKIRLYYIAPLVSFSMIMSFAEIMHIKSRAKKMMHYLNIAIGSFYIITVCQTRVLTISIFMSIVIMILFYKVKNINKKIITIFFLLMSLILIFNLDVTQDFIQSFSSEEDIGSVEARQEAIDYYLDKIGNNPITPIGFLNTTKDSANFYVLHGPTGRAYISDVGVLGITAQIGVLGLIWYVMLVGKMLIISYKSKKYGNANQNIQLIGISTFLILTSGTILITNPERVLILPIMMSIFDYSYRGLLKNKNSKYDS